MSKLVELSSEITETVGLCAGHHRLEVRQNSITTFQRPQIADLLKAQKQPLLFDRCQLPLAVLSRTDNPEPRHAHPLRG